MQSVTQNELVCIETHTDPATGWMLVEATVETLATGRQEIMATWRDAIEGDYILFHSVKTGKAVMFLGAYTLPRTPIIPQEIIEHLMHPQLLPGTRYAHPAECCPRCGRIFGQPPQPNGRFLPEIVNEDGSCWNTATCDMVTNPPNQQPEIPTVHVDSRVAQKLVELAPLKRQVLDELGIKPNQPRQLVDNPELTRALRRMRRMDGRILLARDQRVNRRVASDSDYQKATMELSAE